MPKCLTFCNACRFFFFFISSFGELDSLILVQQTHFFQEMFERIDKEADGEVYVKEVTDFLRVLDDNLEQNEEVFDGIDEILRKKVHYI
jgi:Ca2+-binding EF-hand superfamily protein